RARQAPTFAAVTWIFFRHAYDPDRGVGVWRDCADLIGELANNLPEQYGPLLQLVGYSLLQNLGTSDELREELRRVGGPKAEEVAVTAGEQLMERGREQGLEQGRLEGGQRLLLSILARLGGVTPEVEARVQGATEVDLENWAQRALSAGTIEDVFKG
ncbi:MAG: hypothetical protein JKY65_03735, partial [Planctomycetes bacterium]|nr:hypothetical protein [Planctomycetota bacterium]